MEAAVHLRNRVHGGAVHKSVPQRASRLVEVYRQVHEVKAARDLAREHVDEALLSDLCWYIHDDHGRSQILGIADARELDFYLEGVGPLMAHGCH